MNDVLAKVCAMGGLKTQAGGKMIFKRDVKSNM